MSKIKPRRVTPREKTKRSRKPRPGRWSESLQAKANRLESVLFMAVGVVHDFNSVLTGVLASLEGAKSGIERVRAGAIADAERSAWKARELTAELMAVAVDRPEKREPLDLVELVRRSMKFALRGGCVRCVERFGDNIRPVEGSRNQIGRVIHNLALNARQAMPKGGTVRVEIVNAALRKSVGRGLSRGDYVRITLTDEGPGIRPESLGRIFEPFFTTKEGGSGLGLAVAAAIVKAHGGAITAGSGSGATFSVYLPARPPALKPAP